MISYPIFSDERPTESEMMEIRQMGNLLRYTPGIDKVVIGQYIAEYGPFAQLVREAFVSQFNFA